MNYPTEIQRKQQEDDQRRKDNFCLFWTDRNQYLRKMAQVYRGRRFMRMVEIKKVDELAKDMIDDFEYLAEGGIYPLNDLERNILRSFVDELVQHLFEETRGNKP